MTRGEKAGVLTRDWLDRVHPSPDTSGMSPAELAYGHFESIWRIAFDVTRSEAAAQDVTQDVFVRVLSRGGFDATRGSLEHWLKVVAHHTAVDWVRREAAHRRRVNRVGNLHAATTPMVDEAVVGRVQAARVRAGLALLPGPEREVVSLVYFGGLTYRQAAHQLGLAEGTVKSRTRRALTRLAHIIGNNAAGDE